MARTRNKLTAISVQTKKKPGRYSDGAGLYFKVSPTGSKAWVFMWTRHGKRSEMGLGVYPAVSLAKARTKADHCRQMVAEGQNPIHERNRELGKTFGECADELIESLKIGWSNEKHRYQWQQTLTNYCSAIRAKPVAEIDTHDVLSVLNPIWRTKTETAMRLRGRIEQVLDYARVNGWRDGPNPALWRGNLSHILPSFKKDERVKHQPAMPYVDVSEFVEKLQTKEAMAARALEFLILTAARTGEVLFSTWDEIDFEAKLWSIPKERMKLRRAHRVPLSDRAIKILTPLYELRVSKFVFPGHKPNRPLSNMALTMLMRRMKIENAVPHGFRSSFRDWCGDETSFSREVAEAALAHKVGSEVEQAYRRGDALEKRMALMQAWADYCAGVEADNVVRLRG